MVPPDLIQLLKSPLLSNLPGVIHGFSTRTGGVSKRPFDSLNLGYDVGDDAEDVGANVQLYMDALGLEEVVVVNNQVHGNRVRVIDDAAQAGEPFDGDCLVTKLPGAPIGIRTADCLPVLFVDPDKAIIGAAHCGWRGVVVGAAVACLEKMYEMGARKSKTLVALGPAISGPRFEVGPEVREAFEKAGLIGRNTIVGEQGDRSYISLRDAVRKQLRGFGIKAANIDDLRRCTFEEPIHFFSHRRDKGKTGRHLSTICLGGLNGG